MVTLCFQGARAMSLRICTHRAYVYISLHTHPPIVIYIYTAALAFIHSRLHTHAKVCAYVHIHYTLPCIHACNAYTHAYSHVYNETNKPHKHRIYVYTNCSGRLATLSTAQHENLHGGHSQLLHCSNFDNFRVTKLAGFLCSNVGPRAI